jgi:hypothetical protein
MSWIRRTYVSEMAVPGAAAERSEGEAAGKLATFAADSQQDRLLVSRNGLARGSSVPKMKRQGWIAGGLPSYRPKSRGIGGSSR